MKKISTLLLLPITTVWLWSASLSSTEITNMVAKIKEERSGINLATLETTVNPFPIVKRQPKEVQKEEVNGVVLPKEEPIYLLSAILNHAAFINKKWYKVGQKVGDYQVAHIGNNVVTLKNKGGMKLLSLKKNKQQFIQHHKGY